jgi:ABC-type transport system involved in cytochrome c biogenesis ATPase subunit
MATPNYLGLFDHRRGDAVAILVGPNGSGKSTFLRHLAESHRSENVIAVSNTPHDRFAGMRGIRRISAGRPNHTPANVVKRAIARSLDVKESSFYQISAIMEYCGYIPRFGFRVEKARHYGSSFKDLQLTLENTHGRSENGDFLWKAELEYSDELRRALEFLESHNPSELVWIDASHSAFEFSRSRDFAAVLRCEIILRRLKVIGQIDVLIQRQDHESEVIEIRLASSGQLALISSLLFLITEAGRSPIILIDEPENSLHPSWQREYVTKLMAAMSYRDATLIIATHAPLVVTGALENKLSEVSVFRVRAGRPTRLEIDASASPASIEEILWEAFAVVTPANHFVSREIVRAISHFEDDKIRKDEVLKLVSELEERSFDDQQKRFFGAVRKLVDKVERTKAGLSDGDDFA